MLRNSRRRRVMLAALAGATVTALGVSVASSHGARAGVHDLFRSTPVNTSFAALAAATTYDASLLSPAPRLEPKVSGWLGTQFVSHEAGKVRYETAAFLWRDYSGREIDILSGPAMTLSPAATIARPRSRIPAWNFAPYGQPGPVKPWAIAGTHALSFDATAPPPGVWTLVGSNPPELRIDHDHSFRMAAMSVHGKTVVVVIQAPAATFTEFLPVAERLLASLRFPVA